MPQMNSSQMGYSLMGMNQQRQQIPQMGMRRPPQMFMPQQQQPQMNSYSYSQYSNYGQMPQQYYMPQYWGN
jgi:hypothetical protein